MLRQSRFVNLAATLFIGTGLLLVCQTAESKTKARPHAFHAVGTAVWDNVFAGFDPDVGAHFEGKGHGRQLGRFTQVGELFFESAPAAINPGHGSVKLITRNHDELHFDYEGDLDSTTGLGSGTLTFTGGTGRFTNATGTGTFYAEFDLSNGPANATMTVELRGTLYN